MPNCLRISFFTLLLFCAQPLTVQAQSQTAQNQAAQNQAARAPSSSFAESDQVAAYVHIDLSELAALPQMKMPKQLVKNVESELDKLFKFHAGFQPSQVSTLTYLQPNRDAKGLTNDSDFGVFLIRFADSFNWKKLREDNWKVESFHSREILSNDKGMSLFPVNGQQIALGSPADVRWFVNSAGISKFATSSFNQSEGQLFIGGNLDREESLIYQIAPMEVFGWFPAKRARVAVDFRNGLAVNGNFDFKSELDAQNGTVFLNSSIGMGKQYLEQEANQASERFKGDFRDLESAVNHLSVLSLIREGKQILKNVKVKRASTQVDVRLAVEGLDSNLLIVSALTGIQMLGASAAEADFKDIASELEDASTSKASADALENEFQSSRGYDLGTAEENPSLQVERALIQKERRSGSN